MLKSVECATSALNTCNKIHREASEDNSMKYLLFFYFVVVGLSSVAQTITAIDEATREPIPYATVLIRNGEYGFVANDSGRIELFNLMKSDVLEFRSIGYINKKIKQTEVSDGDSIGLTSSALELNEVVVRPMQAVEYVKLALRSIPSNYYPDSFATKLYYREYLKENNRIVNHAEAVLEAIQTGYLSEKDSFEFRILAGYKSQKEDLEFMLKERDKEIKKELKTAEKEGQEMTEEDFKMPLEIGNPPFLASIDPLRNADKLFVVNDDNVDFLDSTTHSKYDFWYGKPVEYGGQSLVVIHFDQRKSVRKPMLAGTIWIEQASNAFVKIEFGISKQGEKHMVPTFVKAALWIYGLSFDIKNTLVEFNYQPFKGKWALGGIRMKADLLLEKRRLFSENDKSDFAYECEMLTSELSTLPYAFISKQEYNRKVLLSEQLPDTPREEWLELKRKSRMYK